MEELKAFIGVLIASGRCNSSKLSVKNMWNTNPLFNQPFYSAAISRDRFLLIFRTLRFDDTSTRQTRFNLSKDKFEPIREVFETINACFRQNYSPLIHLTVDERMVGFRDRCPFRVYIKSKPARYGLKLWVCADVKTSYILNIQPYTGKICGVKESRQGERVVKELVSTYFGSGHGVTADNFSTSVPLALYLLKKNISEWKFKEKLYLYT